MDSISGWEETGISLEVDNVQYNVRSITYMKPGNVEEYIRFALFVEDTLNIELCLPETTKYSFDIMNPVLYREDLLVAIKKVFPNIELGDLVILNQ